MKSEERHELKTNELQENLQQIIAFAREHGTRLLVGAVLVVAAVAAGFYWNYTRAQAVDQEWTQLQSILESGIGTEELPAGELERLAMEATQPQLAAQAWATLGNHNIYKVLRAEDDAEATAAADAARRAYQEIISKYPSQLISAGSAHLGLAILAENDGDWEQAREHYTQITSNQQYAAWPIMELAVQRKNDLATWDEPVVFATSQPAATQSTSTDTSTAEDAAETAG